MFFVTAVCLWVLFCYITYKANKAGKEEQDTLALRERVALFAAAMDILNMAVVPPQLLDDPVMRRHLMHKLREQRAIDIRLVNKRAKYYIIGTVAISDDCFR